MLIHIVLCFPGVVSQSLDLHMRIHFGTPTPMAAIASLYPRVLLQSIICIPCEYLLDRGCHPRARFLPPDTHQPIRGSPKTCSRNVDSFPSINFFTLQMHQCSAGEQT